MSFMGYRNLLQVLPLTYHLIDWTKQRCHSFSIMGYSFFCSTIYALLHSSQQSSILYTVKLCSEFGSLPPMLLMAQSLLLFLRHTCHGSTIGGLPAFLFGLKIFVWCASHGQAYTSNTTVKKTCNCRYKRLNVLRGPTESGDIGEVTI